MLEHQRMTPEKYLVKVEPAVRHLFVGIEQYLTRYRRLPSPLTLKPGEEIQQYLAEMEELFEGQHSLALLCGSVLQIAAQGLAVCSANATIPHSCASFASKEMARYCVGREVLVYRSE